MHATCWKAAILFIATLAIAISASAEHFLKVDAIKLQPILQVPPAADSLVQRAELEVLLHLQAERTPAAVVRVRQIDDENVFIFGSDVLGPWFEAPNLPQTASFFARVREDFLPINRAAKDFSNRRRPPFADPRIRPCIEYSDTGSYPSGHAIQSEMWAGLLSAIFPEQATHFADRASATRWARLLGGVHFPSDVEAGRMVGEAIAREMLKNPVVQQLVAELRAEATLVRARAIR